MPSPASMNFLSKLRNRELGRKSTNSLVPNLEKTVNKEFKQILKVVKDLQVAIQERNRDDIELCVADIMTQFSEAGNINQPIDLKKKKQHREAFVLFGGLDCLLKLFSPPFAPEDARKIRREDMAKKAELWNEILMILRELIGTIPGITERLFNEKHMVFLFTLLTHSSAFDLVLTVLEEVLSFREDTFNLGSIPNFYSMVEKFSSRQLSQFCRVLSLLIFEPEDRQIMEGSQVLRSLELLRLRRNRMARNSIGIVERNQNLIIEMPFFFPRLIQILRIINYGPNLYDLISNNISQLPMTNDLLNFRSQSNSQGDWGYLSELEEYLEQQSKLHSSTAHPNNYHPNTTNPNPTDNSNNNNNNNNNNNDDITPELLRAFAPNIVNGSRAMDMNNIINVMNIATRLDIAEYTPLGYALMSVHGAGGSFRGHRFPSTSSSSRTPRTYTKARNELRFHAMLLAPHQIELIFVLCTLLTGRRKIAVQKKLAALSLHEILFHMFDRMSWDSPPHTGYNAFEHIHGPDCECNPESAIRIQFLRLVHSFYDRDFLGNANKLLVLSEDEQQFMFSSQLMATIQEVLSPLTSSRSVATRDMVNQEDESSQELVTQRGGVTGKKSSILFCTPQQPVISPTQSFAQAISPLEQGLLSKIISTLIKEKPNSSYRFWLSACIENFLRGCGHVGQSWLLVTGILDNLVQHILTVDTLLTIRQQQDQQQQQQQQQEEEEDQQDEDEGKERGSLRGGKMRRRSGNNNNNSNRNNPVFGAAAQQRRNKRRRQRNSTNSTSNASTFSTDPNSSEEGNTTGGAAPCQTSSDSLENMNNNLQTSFDLLGELVKANPIILEYLEQKLSDGEFRLFMQVVLNHLVDSNVFLRSLYLTLELCQQIDVTKITTAHGNDVEGSLPVPPPPPSTSAASQSPSSFAHTTTVVRSSPSAALYRLEDFSFVANALFREEEKLEGYLRSMILNPYHPIIGPYSHQLGYLVHSWVQYLPSVLVSEAIDFFLPYFVPPSAGGSSSSSKTTRSIQQHSTNTPSKQQLYREKKKSYLAKMTNKFLKPFQQKKAPHDDDPTAAVTTTDSGAPQVKSKLANVKQNLMMGSVGMLKDIRKATTHLLRFGQESKPTPATTTVTTAASSSVPAVVLPSLAVTPTRSSPLPTETRDKVIGYGGTDGHGYNAKWIWQEEEIELTGTLATMQLQDTITPVEDDDSIGYFTPQESASPETPLLTTSQAPSQSSSLLTIPSEFYLMDNEDGGEDVHGKAKDPPVRPFPFTLPPGSPLSRFTQSAEPQLPPEQDQAAGEKSVYSTPAKEAASMTPSTSSSHWKIPNSLFRLGMILIQEKYTILLRLMSTVTYETINHENICCLNTSLMILLLEYQRGTLGHTLKKLRKLADEEYAAYVAEQEAWWQEEDMDEALEEARHTQLMYQVLVNSPVASMASPASSILHGHSNARSASKAVEEGEQDEAEEEEEEEEKELSGSELVMRNFRELLWYWKEYYLRRGRDRLSIEFSSHVPFHYWLEVVELMSADDGSEFSLLSAPVVQSISPYSRSMVCGSIFARGSDQATLNLVMQ